MSGTEKFLAVEKTKKKQNGTPPGRKQMVSLWLAVIAALGTGVPGIVDCAGRLIEGRRSTVKIQELIAKQTSELTKTLNDTVEAVKSLDEDVFKLEEDCERYQNDLAYASGRLELVQDVLRDCCTRRRVLERLREKPRPEPKSEKSVGLPESFVKIWVHDSVDKRPTEQLKKVPDFKQEQIQMQEPQE